MLIGSVDSLEGAGTHVLVPWAGVLWADPRHERARWVPGWAVEMVDGYIGWPDGVGSRGGDWAPGWPDIPRGRNGGNERGEFT